MYYAAYLPGYKGGGPVRSLANLVAALGDEFQFLVVTLDRDLGEMEPYPNVTPGKWQFLGKARVLYMQEHELTLRFLRDLFRTENPDLLYLNSLFSFDFGIKPLLFIRCGLLRNVPVVLAPRGQLGKGARSLKRVRKETFLRVAQLLGLYRNVVWQATSQSEFRELRDQWGARVAVALAPNLTVAPFQNDQHRELPTKRSGWLKLAFVSRICRKKNLHTALGLLRDLKGKFEFDIYGPKEDPDYWELCAEIARHLPANVTTQYWGSVTPDKVASVFASHHVFLFPTLSENFGHVILEALSAGCPVVISDQTPWKGLNSSGAGWAIPLGDQAQFRRVLQQLTDLDNHQWSELSRKAAQYGRMHQTNNSAVAQNRELFLKAVQRLG